MDVIQTTSRCWRALVLLTVGFFHPSPPASCLARFGDLIKFGALICILRLGIEQLTVSKNGNREAIPRCHRNLNSLQGPARKIRQLWGVVSHSRRLGTARQNSNSGRGMRDGEKMEMNREQNPLDNNHRIVGHHRRPGSALKHSHTKHTYILTHIHQRKRGRANGICTCKVILGDNVARPKAVLSLGSTETQHRHWAAIMDKQQTYRNAGTIPLEDDDDDGGDDDVSFLKCSTSTNNGLVLWVEVGAVRR